MTKKLTAVLAYLGIVFWGAAYIWGDREGAKRNLNEGLVLVLIEVIACVIGKLPLIGGILRAVVIAGCVLLALLGVYYAVKEEDTPVPFLSDITLLK